MDATIEDPIDRVSLTGEAPRISPPRATLNAAAPPAEGTLEGAKKPRLTRGAAAAAAALRQNEASPARQPSGGGKALLEEEKTPSQQQPSTPRAPAAPSKSGGSSYNRMQPSPAVRSLTPLFNGCTQAAERARQMGGQFVRRRPQQTAAAAPSAGNPPVTSGPKRSRSVLGELLQSPSAFLGRRRGPGAAAAALAALPVAGGKAAASASCGAATAPLSPAPTPLSLQPGPVTTFLAEDGEAAPEGGTLGSVLVAVEGAAGPEGPARARQQLLLPRRPAGRPVGHHSADPLLLEEHAGEAGMGLGWLRSAVFKAR